MPGIGHGNDEYIKTKRSLPVSLASANFGVAVICSAYKRSTSHCGNRECRLRHDGCIEMMRELRLWMMSMSQVACEREKCAKMLLS